MSGVDKPPQHCETIAVLVRGGPAYKRPGDPFAWSCCVVRDDVDAGHIMMMHGVPTPDEMRQARDELRTMGFARLAWTRTSGRRGTLSIEEGGMKNVKSDDEQRGVS